MKSQSNSYITLCTSSKVQQVSLLSPEVKSAYEVIGCYGNDSEITNA